MAVNLTSEQRSSLQSKGKIIVSASAGSGKTFIMIKRLVNLILSGAEMQDFIAATFTKKAATAMKEKLRAALILAINEAEDENIKSELKRKLSALPTADISTIHSFCSHLLRSYFYELGISDSFEIISSDSAEGKAVWDDAMENTLAEAYESDDEDFMLLLKAFRSRKKNEGVVNAIRKVYIEVRSYVDYRSEIEKLGEFTEEKFNFFAESIKREFDEKADKYLALLKEFDSSLGFAPEDGIEVYDYIKDNLLKIKNAEDCFVASNLEFSNAPKKCTKKNIDKKTKYPPEAFLFRDDINKLKDSVKDFLAFVIAKPMKREEELFKYLESGKVMRALYKYVIKFDEEYSRLKSKKSKLDYNDLEHYTIALLENENVRRAIKDKYKYLFVDEYQDVNPAQEQILSLIGAEEVFLVGDKKQAIYSFRGSKSKYFDLKEKEFGDGSLKLSSNFRSAPLVLDFVNEVFSEVMTKESCGIDYKSSPMRGGDSYGEYGGIVKIYETEKVKKVSEKPSGVYSADGVAALMRDYRSVQSETIYSIIRSCVSTPTVASGLGGPSEELYKYYDIEDGRFKRVHFGDIAVLVRSYLSTETKNIINYLVECGVPVTSLAEINVCDYPEVKKLINVLEYIDNPESDVPLCSCLLSPLGGFNENDLAEIKLYADKAYVENSGVRFFRRDCKLYAETANDALSQKLNEFYVTMNELTLKSRFSSAREILGEILSDYGMENEILSKDNGKNCMARVDRFLSECGEDSVHEFLTRLKNLGYNVKYTENNGDNSVKILTIHASKGLEYPVVILADLNKSFHSESGEELLKEDEYGFVPKYYDFENMIKSPTIFSLYARLKNEKEQIKDELNVFYVAVTRAKYALHMVLGERKEPSAEMHSFADFLSREVRDKYAGEVSLFGGVRAERNLIPIAECDEELSRLKGVYKKEYPFGDSVNIAVKSSATTLLKSVGEEEEFYVSAHPFKAIDEGGKNMEINAEVGTAYHAFLEHADFSSSGEYEKMKDILPEEQFKLLSKSKCEKILAMPVFKKLSGSTLFKEKRFIVSFPANKFDETVKSTDEVIYQGAIDLIAMGDDGITIVDYKYSSRSSGDIYRHYLPQIRLYRAAAAKLFKIDEKSIKTYIVNILSGEEIPVDA